MSNDNDPPGRQTRSLQGLLRFCVEQTAAEDAPGESGATMSEDRREFLRQALSSMEDVVVQMRRHVSTISEFVEGFKKGDSESVDRTAVDHALDSLTEIVAELDNATEFQKMDGISLFAPLLQTNEKTIQIKACELIAELVQNHSRCQAAVVEANLLGLLVKTVDSHEDEDVRTKSLYALSCLLRGNESLQTVFEAEHDGFSVLMRAMQRPSTSSKLATKASFLLTSLCQQQPRFKDTLSKMGFVEQIVALLHKEHDSSHEFLLAALYALISEHEPSLKESRRAELGFKRVLSEKMEKLKGLEEDRESCDYCSRLLNLCFSSENNDTEDTER